MYCSEAERHSVSTASSPEGTARSLQKADGSRPVPCNDRRHSRGASERVPALPTPLWMVILEPLHLDATEASPKGLTPIFRKEGGKERGNIMIEHISLWLVKCRRPRARYATLQSQT